MSSPKKLLTPIKNLFSTKSSASTPSTSDSLQNAINSKGLRRKHRHKHSRSHSSFSESEHQDTRIYDWIPEKDTKSKSPPVKISTSSPSLLNSFKKSQSHSSLASFQSFNSQTNTTPSTTQTRLKPPLGSIEPVQEAGVSTSSIVESEFETKQVSFSANIEDKALGSGFQFNSSSEEVKDEDSEELSDTSSQFSFVKDKIGGRNTSVKYYKTKKSPEYQVNRFNENDLNYEMDDYEDYDFENNGMDDHYEDEEDVNYNNLFEDELDVEKQHPVEDDPEIDPEIDSDNNEFDFQNSTTFSNQTVEQPAPSPAFEKFETMTADKPSGRRKFNGSLHLSIQGPPDEVTESPESDVYDDDILENYLDVSKLPSLEYGSNSTVSLARKTPDPNTDDLELFDVSSPVINGLTIGYNLKHRMRDNSKADKQKGFVHRLCEQNHGLESAALKDEDVLKSRVLKSFHSSLDEETNKKILKNIEEYEAFVAKKSQKGLGILLPKEEAENKDIHPSVNELIDILDSLELNVDEGKVDNAGITNRAPQITTDERLSVVGMMSLLANLEQSQADIVKENPSLVQAKENRRSIIDMMSVLSSLESNDTELTHNDAKNKRDSITNMMTTLANLDLSNLNPNAPERREKAQKHEEVLSSVEEDVGVRNHKPEIKYPAEYASKRYSWFNNDEAINLRKLNSLLKNEYEINNDEYDDSYVLLDQDLIDEINQLPEDFDFEEQASSNHLAPNAPLFLRSNSYNKKPVKSVVDNGFQSNKIETVHKTVTFYRNNTSPNSENARSRSVSRAPSTRSVTSFASENLMEEEEEEDNRGSEVFSDDLSPLKETAPYLFKLKTVRSTDSALKKMTTITEGKA